MNDKSKLPATAQKYINGTVSDSTYQSYLLAFSFLHYMCAKAHFFKKQRATFLSELNIPERIILFFFLFKQRTATTTPILFPFLTPFFS